MECNKDGAVREIGAPLKDQASSFPCSSRQQQQGTNYPAANESSTSGVKLPTASNLVQTELSGFDSTVRANIQQDQVFKKRDANRAQPYATTARQSAHPGQPAGGNLKRAHAEAAMSALNQEAFLEKGNSFMKTDAGLFPDSVSPCSKADRLIKNRRIAELNSKFQRKGMVNELAAKGGSSSQGNIHGNENGVLRAERVAVVGGNKPRSSRELSNLEIRNMLAEKARMEITKKLKEWSTTAASRTLTMKEKKVEKKQAAPEVIKTDPRRDKTAHDAVVDSKIVRKQKKWPVFSAPVDLEPEAMSMTVPDSDFHNFDKDRTEKSFDDKQVWAAYDDDDAMPRYYALIHKVMSKKPFKCNLAG